MTKATTACTLKWVAHEEMPIDRVAAIGFALRYMTDKQAAELADNMIRVDALSAQALREVIELTKSMLNHKYRITRSFAERLVLAVLYEIMRPNCVHCGGTGEKYAKHTATQLCEYCNGSGVHCYSDADRQVLVGRKYNQRAYEDTLTYVKDSLAELHTRAQKRLG